MPTQCKHPRPTPGDIALIIYSYYCREALYGESQWLEVIVNFLHGTGHETTWRFNKLKAIQDTLIKVEVMRCNYCDHPGERKEGKKYFQELKCSNRNNTHPIVFEYTVLALGKDNILRKYLMDNNITFCGDDDNVEWNFEE